ncbi:MAG: cyclic nucleotide-binding domain-containing protein, partial [Bacteroidota bacterium]|nr:cyclic nucleotide-binding domain-containing protein [Bacteroidota bacterium]
MKELLNFLNSIHPLSQQAIDYLNENLKQTEVSKKKSILKQGRICYNIYFVEKGLLRCFYNKNGKEINSWFMKEGDVIFSVESFINQTPSYENIQAIEDSILYYIDYNELQFLYENCLEF